MPEENKEVWFNRPQAAAYLTKNGCPIAPGTLAKMASNNNEGKGPPYTRFRWKAVRYNQTDLDAWRSTQAVRVT